MLPVNCELPTRSRWHPRYAAPGPGALQFTQYRLARPERLMAPEAGSGAIEFLARLLADARRVTLVATGPLTTYGTLLHRYPRLRGNIERLVFMGGWPTRQLPEHNIREDPEAASTVVNSGIPFIAVGYEVTLNCLLRQSHLATLHTAQDPGPRFLQALYRAWSQAKPEYPPLMHDPLTVALLCDPSLVRLKEARLAVALEAGAMRGVMHLAGEGVELQRSAAAGARTGWNRTASCTCPPRTTGALRPSRAWMRSGSTSTPRCRPLGGPGHSLGSRIFPPSSTAPPQRRRSCPMPSGSSIFGAIPLPRDHS